MSHTPIRTTLAALVAGVCALVCTFALVCACVPARAYADSASTILTLGADLTSSQQATVLEFFGLTEDDLDSMEVITVTNSDEREYLEGTVSDSIIGTKTLSCSYIQLTSSGGIEVETANLTYVTKNTIYNALQTAGIENCTVVVTAPYEVSGTGALTGIFLAVEADGTELDEEKKEAATEELVATAELEDEYGSEVAEVISDVKDEVTSSDEDLSSEEIASIVEDTAAEYDLSLSDDAVATITNLAETIQSLDYDTNAFSNTLSDFMEGNSGFISAIKSFFQSIVDFFKGLFGGGSTSIIDDLNTEVYELDDTESSSSASTESSSNTSTESSSNTSTESSSDTTTESSESSSSTNDNSDTDSASDAGESSDVDEASAGDDTTSDDATSTDDSSDSGSVE